MSETAGMSQLLSVALFAVVPMLLIVGTSFAKTYVVLAIVRNALGAEGIPPAPVVTGLAAVLSIFIMAPVASDMSEAAKKLPPTPKSDITLADLGRTAAVVSPPLVDFLKRNTPDSEIAFFSEMARESRTASPGLRILLPAFASAELVEALLMGVLIFVPFLLVDLLVATVLNAMGLANLSTATVAVPMKILLFLAADGWHLLVSALITSYGM